MTTLNEQQTHAGALIKINAPIYWYHDKKYSHVNDKFFLVIRCFEFATRDRVQFDATQLHGVTHGKHSANMYFVVMIGNTVLNLLLNIKDVDFLSD